MAARSGSAYLFKSNARHPPLLLYKFFTQLVIQIKIAICFPILFEDLFPGVQRFPDTGSLPLSTRNRKGDVIDLPFALGVFHYDDILIVLAGQVIYIVFQVGEAAMPFRVIRQTNNVKGYLPLQHIVKKEMRFVICRKGGEGDVNYQFSQAWRRAR